MSPQYLVFLGLLATGPGWLPGPQAVALVFNYKNYVNAILKGGVIGTLMEVTSTTCLSACARQEGCVGSNWLTINSTSLPSGIPKGNCELLSTIDSNELDASSSSASVFVWEETLEVRGDKPGRWGGWYGPKLCSPWSYVYGYVLWTDDFNTPGVDDCGLTRVELLCRTPEGRRTDILVLGMDWPTSYRKELVTCDPGDMVVAFRSKFLPEWSDTDDIALGNLELKCDKGKVLDGGGYIGREDLWTTWQSCPDEHLPCGMKLQQETSASDFSCANEFVMICCRT
ncbi:uncharacterized protein LOC143018416 [Oratosquilla oratoria]|uniref:uncharacterized protein LOC143018416 n=1 Tax=Oratosquilla oratoria TaxID=337810 RepID=UPI003F75737C